MQTTCPTEATDADQLLIRSVLTTDHQIVETYDVLDLAEALGVIERQKLENQQLRQAFARVLIRSARRRELLIDAIVREQMLIEVLLQIRDHREAEGLTAQECPAAQNARERSAYALKQLPLPRVTIDDLLPNDES